MNLTLDHLSRKSIQLANFRKAHAANPSNTRQKAALQAAEAAIVVGCYSCRHAGTHAACYKGEERNASGVFIKGGCQGLPAESNGNDSPYKNWEPGDWWADLNAAHDNGSCDLVIGGQGEISINAKNRFDQWCASAKRIAEDCGYIVSINKTARTAEVYNCGRWLLTWAMINGVERISTIHQITSKGAHLYKEYHHA